MLSGVRMTILLNWRLRKVQSSKFKYQSSDIFLVEVAAQNGLLLTTIVLD